MYKIFCYFTKLELTKSAIYFNKIFVALSQPLGWKYTIFIHSYDII